MDLLKSRHLDIKTEASPLPPPPLSTRRPAAPSLSCLSLPCPDPTPSISMIHPVVSPNFISPPWCSSSWSNPYSISPLATSPAYYPCNVQRYTFPVCSQNPANFTSYVPATIPPVWPHAVSSVSHTPVLQPSRPVQDSPVTETRPLDSLYLPTCPTEKHRTECDVYQLMSSVMDQVTPKTVNSDRQSDITNRLRSLQSRFPSQVKELLAFLTFHSAAIQKEKQQCLSDGHFPEDYNTWLNQRYSQQLQLLFTSVERRLWVLENQDKKRSGVRALNPEAIRVMEKWYLQHQNNPYPSAADADDLATLGGITRQQVRKWFANKRHRTRAPAVM